MIHFWIIFGIFATFSVDAKPPPTQVPKLLVVSYDGFRYDYFNRSRTPYMKKLRTKGIYTDYMRNVFVTKTFPNHHSIATGMYVENHGVVDSEFYDPSLNKTFQYSSELYHYSNKILPIWTLNEMAGGDHHSGVMMWPGGTFEYQGINATFRKIWNIKEPWENRIDELISWFKDPKTPINFGILYIEEPDFHGHGIGINNERFNEILSKIDNITLYLHQKLKMNNLIDVNVIHLSDHGMASVTLDRIINLNEYINESDYTMAGVSPVINIYPKTPEKHILIYKNLKRAAESNGNFDVYLKEDIPERYHFGNNPRNGPILVVAKVGYAFQTMYKSIEWYKSYFNITVNNQSEFGVHGYDNNVSQMHPFFFGVGSAFIPECKVPPFDNIDLLPLFCEVLQIQCNDVNGTIGPLKNCIKKYRYEAYLYKGIYIGGIIISIVGIIILFLVYLKRKRAELHKSMYRMLREGDIDENQFWFGSDEKT